MLLLAVVLAGCAAPGADPQPAARSAQTVAAAPAVLAEAESANPRIRIQVIEVRRTGPEALSVKFRLVNPDGNTQVSLGDVFADTPGDVGSFSGVSLLDASGQKKVFVLRDDQGRPQCSMGVGPIPPGGGLEAWARFPVPVADVTRVTVQLPGVAPLRDLLVSGAPSGTGLPGTSY